MKECIGTYTARFRYFKNNYAAPIRSFHLYVQFLVPDDEDDVNYGIVRTHKRTKNRHVRTYFGKHPHML